MPVPYKPKPKSTNMGEKIVKTEVRKAQMSKPSPKPKPVSEADKKKAELLKNSYDARMKEASKNESLAKTLNRPFLGNKGIEDSRNFSKLAKAQMGLAKKDSIGAVKLNPDAFKKKK